MVADLPPSRGVCANFSPKLWRCRLPLKVVESLFPKRWGAYFPQVATKTKNFLAFLLLLFLRVVPMSFSCSSSVLSRSSWFCAFVFINYFLTKRLLEGKCWPFLPSSWLLERKCWPFLPSSWLLEGKCWLFLFNSCGGHVFSVILHFWLLAVLLSCSFVFFSFAFLFWLFLFSFLCGVCVWRIVFLLSSCAMFGYKKFL